MNKASELREFVERVLVEEGVARPYEFSIARNAHQQVVFYVKGIKVKYQFPCSPSDHRAMLNSRSSVRKAIRTASGFALSGAPAQRSLLDARGLLPCQSHHVGAGRAGVSKLAPSVHGRWPCPGQALKAGSRS
jgi:hypothetical protein